MGQRKKPKEPEEEFILYLKEHGASEHTVDSCLAALRLFFRLYGEISAENLDAFRRYLMERYKISTVNSRIYGINRFLAYCSECKNSYETSGKWALPEKNFRLGVIRSQNPPFLDNIISEKDYEKLRDNLKKDQDMKWYFAVRFLACTGARVSELIQIKREHIQLGYMDLYTKGGKVRRIYFPDYLCSEASGWMDSQNMGSGFLFRNRKGGAVSPRWINSQLKLRARQYGIPEETVYPHSFRHRFAKNFLARCNDIALLADLMGHESIETTRIYLTRSSEEQQKLIDRVVKW